MFFFFENRRCKWFLRDKNVYNMLLYNSLNCFAVVNHGEYSDGILGSRKGGGEIVIF